MPAAEANFDGLVGPTHNYAGLSPGNLASQKHAGSVASPKTAALQGLAKAMRLSETGFVQHVLPPHERPNIRFLRRHGFGGSDDNAIIERAAREAPGLLSAACSASSMWAANAATVSPSADTADGRVHLTPANLAFNPHRCQEPRQSERILRAIFADEGRFCVHECLAMTPVMFDEGAANHTRLTGAGLGGHGGPGVELFVHGKDGLEHRSGVMEPTRLPPRQSADACFALARSHGLDESRTVFARQHPGAIDAGVFHNDVISVGNGNVLFVHERAYADQELVLAECREKLKRATGEDLVVIEVAEDDVTLDDCVTTYLFNSQLLTLPSGHGLDDEVEEDRADLGGKMMLFGPQECAEHSGVRDLVERIVADPANPIAEGVFIDVRESMRNGGGPACLRLRVVLTDEEQAALSGDTRLTHAKYGQLTGWVEKHYRDELAPGDLADPKLLIESRDALDELTRILGLGSVYPFQGAGPDTSG